MSQIDYPLTQPCIDADDVRAMEAAVRDCAIADGPRTRTFESDFAAYLGVDGAVATNSCTSALVLALAVLEIGPGDEVALPSYTCLALINAIAQVGATPRLADNSYDVATMDYNVTAESLRRVITSRTKAILLPHMFGVPAPIDSIASIGLPIIEDITLSLGASWGGRMVGAWGDLSVCSFHESKMIACGEGGILTANKESLLAKARYLNGWASEQAASRLQDQAESFRLRYNFHMTGIAAALGSSQLKKLPAFVARRRELARRYSARLARMPRLQVPSVSDRPNVFHRFLVAREDADIVALIRRFAAVGIEVGRGVYPPLHHFLRQDNGDFPGAQRAMGSLLSIPIYPSLSDDRVDQLLHASEAILSD